MSGFRLLFRSFDSLVWSKSEGSFSRLGSDRAVVVSAHDVIDVARERRKSCELGVAHAALIQTKADRFRRSVRCGAWRVNKKKRKQRLIVEMNPAN